VSSCAVKLTSSRRTIVFMPARICRMPRWPSCLDPTEVPVGEKGCLTRAMRSCRQEPNISERRERGEQNISTVRLIVLRIEVFRSVRVRSRARHEHEWPPFFVAPTSVCEHARTTHRLKSVPFSGSRVLTLFALFEIRLEIVEINPIL
jgi:hypothetical protein